MTTQTQVRSTEEALSVYDTLRMAIKAMKSFQEGTGGLYEGEFDEEIKAIEEALQSNEQELDYKAIGQQAYKSGYSTGYMDCAVKMKAQPEQERPQNCGTSICSCIECVMEPDYRALWEQLCERCDGLDEKLAQLEHGWTPERIAGIARLKEAHDKKLAQQEHLEPVAWIDDYNACKCPDNEARCFSDKVFRMMQKHTPQRKEPEQEPVAKVCHDLDGHVGWNPKLTQLPDEGTPIYTTPYVATPRPQRTWVGLTEEDVMSITFNFDVSSLSLVAKAVEAKLKEKNERSEKNT